MCPADVNPGPCGPETQIAPTATSCQDYVNGTAADLEELLYGLKGGVINSISPGVLFLYDTFHLDAACSTVTVIQTDGPWEPQFIGVHQSQVVLYNTACGKLNVGTVSINAFGDVTITGVPPGDYVLGIKYDPTTLKGFSPPGGSPSATFSFAVATCGTGSGSDSIDVNPKP
ncbi:MAG TPA: hypothetical protein VJM12_03880 [Pyrinomonadaceae bacterium]|nr:hypothetical protein [Pyrinomonadaceae bacterium]